MFRVHWALSLLCCFAAQAQIPLISYRGVTNAASRMPAGLAAGSIARGSIFTVTGQNLGPAKEVLATTYPLDKTLGGVALKVVVGTTTYDTLPLYVSATQLQAIMPSNVPLGAASLQLTYNNFRSSLAPVQIVATSFGAFSMNDSGYGPAVAQNIVVTSTTTTDDDGNETTTTSTSIVTNTPAAPAKPGQQVILWGTGLGAVAGADNIAPVAGDPATAVEVWAGGSSAKIVSSGRSACCTGTDSFGFGVPAEVTGAAGKVLVGPGTDQIVFQLADDTPLGCYVPVQVRAGKLVSNTVTIAVSADGSACSDPANTLSQQLTKGKMALLAGIRTTLRMDQRVPSPVDAVIDSLLVSLRQETGAAFAFNPLFALPPAGACSTYTTAGDVFDSTDLPGIAPSGKVLNGGANIDLTGSKGARRVLLNQTSSLRISPLGLNRPGTPIQSNLYLEPGDFQVTSAGGPDVPRLRTSFTMPAASLSWTNRDKVTALDRTQPVSLTWTGAPSAQPVGIFGMAVDRPNNASAIFICMAAPGATSFTIPSWVLANLPVTRSVQLQSRSGIWIGSLPLVSPQPFTVDGLDLALALPVTLSAKTVTIK